MKDKKWFQHISGTGNRYQLIEDAGLSWLRARCPKDRVVYYLPRSEYRECEPPEIWEGITAECYVTSELWPSRNYGYANALCLSDSRVIYKATEHAKGFRLRMDGSFLIVERKQ